MIDKFFLMLFLTNKNKLVKYLSNKSNIRNTSYKSHVYHQSLPQLKIDYLQQNHQ